MKSEFVFRGMRLGEDELEPLVRYVEDRIPTGGFLEAVLSNDLKEAVGHADERNMHLIPAYVAYAYNEMPAQCWGSREKVRAWLRGEEAPVNMVKLAGQVCGVRP